MAILITNHQSSIKSSNKLVYTPSLGYYHKSGFGIGATGSAIADGFKNINLYQVAATASYDYMQSSQFLTGVAYTQFFTKDSIDFYTSPLTSEASGYFLYRNSWLKPSIAVNYAWGSKTHVEERQEKIKLLRGKPLNSTTIIETTENVSDFSLALSVKHDFYWLNVLLDKDYFRFSPQLSLISGTQRFGFNQASNANYFNSKSGISVLQNTEELNLSENSAFQTTFSFGTFAYRVQHRQILFSTPNFIGLLFSSRRKKLHYRLCHYHRLYTIKSFPNVMQSVSIFKRSQGF